MGEAIKKVWQSELSNEKLKRYHEKYKIPSNCLFIFESAYDGLHISKPSKAHDVKLQKHIRTQDIPDSAKKIILASWSTTTKNRYNTTYRKWQDFVVRETLITLNQL